MSIKPFKKIIEKQAAENSAEAPAIKPFKTEPTGDLDTHAENFEDYDNINDAKNASFFQQFFAYFSTFGGIFVAILLFILVAILSNTIQTIQDIMTQGSLAQYLYLVGLLALLLVLVLNIFSNIRQLRTLQYATDIKEKFKRQKKQPTQEIVTLAEKLLKQYEKNPDPKLQQHITQIRASIDTALVYADIYHDLDTLLLSTLDEKAKKLIHKASLQAALSTAISPIPLFDMLLILWRSLLLTKEIALLYGFRPGGLMRVILLKQAVVHIAFAGVTELATDLVNQTTGASLLTKISESAGQGIANGVLLSRLGYGIIDSIRPIEPGHNKIGLTQQIIKDIAHYFKIHTKNEVDK